VGKSKRLKKPSKSKPLTYGKGPVRYSLHEGTALVLQLNIEKAQVPENSFFANTISVHADPKLASVTLSFGQLAPESNRCLKQFDIAMPESPVFDRYLKSIAGMEKTVDKALSIIKRTPIKSIAWSQAEQIETLYSNHIYASTSGEESCLDFYYISPLDIHLARTQKANIALTPVIRIILSVVLFKHFCDLIRQSKSSKGNSPKVESEVEHARTR